jgi:hypothetical protein
MPAFITLMLLACAPLVVGYLAWRYQCSRGVTTHDQHQETKRRGERLMTSVMLGPEGDRAIRWMEESPAAFESIRQLLRERSQFKVVAEAAQKDCERFQQQCEALREEVRRLQVETARLRTARAETAQWFSAMIKETAARLRSEPPPA